MFEIININTIAIQGLWIDTRISETVLTGAAMYSDTKSTVSLTGVYKRHRRSRLSPACKRCRFPRAGEAGFLPISAGKKLVFNK